MRDLCDGGGLCSPGRWEISCRTLPEGPLVRLRLELRLAFLQWQAQLEAVEGVGAVDRRMATLLAGEARESPFPHELCAEIRQKWSASLGPRGSSPAAARVTGSSG